MARMRVLSRERWATCGATSSTPISDFKRENSGSSARTRSPALLTNLTICVIQLTHNSFQPLYDYALLTQGDRDGPVLLCYTIDADPGSCRVHCDLAAPGC
jgi:hypothetical protein